MSRLAGKVCVITGAKGGIGAATAALFAREGATVVGVDLADDGPGDFALGCDVADERAVRELFATVRERCGHVELRLPALDVPTVRCWPSPRLSSLSVCWARWP